MTDSSLPDVFVHRLFSGIRSFSAGGQRAPHKPLLLLMALAALQRGGTRWLHYRAIETPLAELILTFGPGNRNPRPAYPFWRLRHDRVGDISLWEIAEAPELLPHQNANGEMSVPALRNVDARGGFSVPVLETLKARPVLVNSVAAVLLDNAFPPSMHEDVLDAVGFTWEGVKKARRDPRFREEVLRIYERRCAICEFTARLGTADFGVEAAHIRWHAAGGPDSADNGLALCTFHHLAFDRGAIGLGESGIVLVSQHVVGGPHVEGLLHRHSGVPVRGPQPGTPGPRREFVRWHLEQVFRHPARGA